MEDRIWAALAPASSAKGVKDVLKERGWLDLTRKVGAASRFGGCVAFPLLPAALADARSACESGEPSALTAVESVQQVTGLEKAKRAPPQGKKAVDGAPGIKAKKRPQQQQPRSFGGGIEQLAGGSTLPPARPVRRVQCPPDADNAWLRKHVTHLKHPAVLVGLDLGPCVGGWTAQRLAAAQCTCEAVSVHVCLPQSDAAHSSNDRDQRRNFAFKTLPFAEAVQRCASDEDAPFEPLLEKGEKYYLRSVGADPRHQASDFHELFPDLALECTLLPPRGAGNTDAAVATNASARQSSELQPEPELQREPLLDPEQYHSSVLRLASSNTQLWTHFDVMDNILAQITGHKRVVLWPPEQDENLYVTGSSSSVECVDRWNDEAFPLFRRAVQHRTECYLAPGELLYIPALWFHNVTSIGFSVAVNVFWRGGVGPDTAESPRTNNVDQKSQQRALSDLYDRKDLYGNKDPPAASVALDHTAVAVGQLERLPQPFRSFYARRAARELLALASIESSQLHTEPQECTSPAAETPKDSALETASTVLLNSGHRMPLLGFTTRQISRSMTEIAVQTAIDAGVRHIDTGSIYQNEVEVGKALHRVLSARRLTRNKLWITGKLWNTDHGPGIEQVRAACVRSLVALGLDCFDLYLMHWPIASGASSGTSIEATWHAMEQLVTDGLVRSIGVANFGIVRLRTLCEASRITPAVNQVEVHPSWRNQALIEACTEMGVHVTASTPLGSAASLLQEPAVTSLAEMWRLTPAQLVLCWGIWRGCSVIPRSSSPQHIKENAHCMMANTATEHARAMEASDWSPLDRLTQHRQVDGADLLVADSRQVEPEAIRTLADLWEEEDNEGERETAC